jgi:hypothetical protein
LRKIAEFTDILELATTIIGVAISKSALISSFANNRTAHASVYNATIIISTRIIV